MKPVFLIVLFFLLQGCYNVERNCNDFKTGEFEFSYVINGEEKTGKFIRTDSLSIDYYDNKIDSSSVRWINDCEFILKKINPTSMAEKEAIHMKILSTDKNTYTFEYKKAIKKPNSKLQVKKGVAKKIK